jgi:hypothetical protein
MTLTKQEMQVIKALVEQELSHMEHDEKLSLVNSPVLSTIVRLKDTDIPLMKQRVLYKEFLGELLNKLQK